MDTFSLLEDKVRKAASLVRELRQRNQSLERSSPKCASASSAWRRSCPSCARACRTSSSALQAAEKTPGPSSDDAARPRRARKLAATEQELKGLRQEREEVRVRIARLMEVLDGLE